MKTASGDIVGAPFALRWVVGATPSEQYQNACINCKKKDGATWVIKTIAGWVTRNQ
jgi:hypothetical protein